MGSSREREWYFIRKLRSHEQPERRQRIEIQVLDDAGKAEAVGYIDEETDSLEINGVVIPWEILQVAQSKDYGQGDYVDSEGNSIEPFKLMGLEELIAKRLHAGPAPESVIWEAEKSLGVVFPPSYRRFLMKFGAALGEGFELAGLFEQGGEDEPPQWNHVVSQTLRLRRASHHQLPPSLIAVLGDGEDHVYYIDTTRRRADGESPVVAIGPGTDNVVIADNFSVFVIRIHKGRIAF
ncbi:MAG: SMI1/KNR4 family protein [Acidobacteria bacterium]|nr:SMI1/KNR4 family protein [Acidobacteriota bacterium]